jgi:hypothetical protein
MNDTNNDERFKPNAIELAIKEGITAKDSQIKYKSK